MEQYWSELANVISDPSSAWNFEVKVVTITEHDITVKGRLTVTTKAVPMPIVREWFGGASFSSTEPKALAKAFAFAFVDAFKEVARTFSIDIYSVEL